MPFSVMTAEGLTINLDGTGRLHYLVRGNVVSDLNDLATDPVIAPNAEGRGLYVLKYSGVTEIHTNFDSFVQHIKDLLEDGYSAEKTNAMGRFDDASSVLTADVVEIHLGIVASSF